MSPRWDDKDSRGEVQLEAFLDVVSAIHSRIQIYIEVNVLFVTDVHM